MKNRLFAIAGVSAIVAAAGAFYALPAIAAQVKAAITQDRDSKARNFYQEVQGCYNVTNPCVIAFATVPAGKRLIIEHVSALATLPTAAAGTLADVELRGSNGSGVFQFLPIVAAPGNFGGEVQYTVNQPVLAAYEAGETPNVDAFVGSVGTFSTLASISGYMIDLP